MNMKSYIATYFRHNPQFKSGGYETTRKRAREITEHCVYGSMELLDVRKEA